MNGLNPVSESFTRRLPADLKAKVEVGYLNNELERTKDGIHMFLNFLEDKYATDFQAYINSRKEEKIAAAKEACGI